MSEADASREQIRRRTVRRVVILTVVVLFIGAAINCAVSWTIAFKTDPSEWMGRPATGLLPSLQGRSRDETPAWVVFQYELSGAQMLMATADKRDITPTSRNPIGGKLPGWSQARRPPTTDQANGAQSVLEFAYGWPRVSMGYELAAGPKGGVGVGGFTVESTRYGIPLQRTSSVGGFWDAFDAIPLRPLFPGFAINTLAYSLGPLAGIGLVALRRLRRLRTGRCEACGHPLGAATRCPECGRVTSSRTGTT